MLKNDYLVRQIEQLVQAMARIASRRKAGDYGAAQDEVENTLSALSGLSGSAILAMPMATLFDLLGKSEQGFQKAGLVGSLLIEHGRNYAETGNETQAKQSYMKAFLLFDELDKNAPSSLSDPMREQMGWLVETLSAK